VSDSLASASIGVCEVRAGVFSKLFCAAEAPIAFRGDLNGPKQPA
jgi:hypothetical protein